MNYTVEPIAHIYNAFTDKFGIPRQSGLDFKTESEIVFTEKFRDDNSLRGLDGYSHIWLLWIFSESKTEKDWSPTVRPPRLGGNKRMGVFATRSPYHPNRIGLSCVKISSIEKTSDRGSVIKVIGADLMNNTPIIDIKPYLTFTDSNPNAVCGFADEVLANNLSVKFECETTNIPNEITQEIERILSQDPHPSYQHSSERVYSMSYSDYTVKFRIDDDILIVIQITSTPNGSEK